MKATLLFVGLISVILVFFFSCKQAANNDDILYKSMEDGFESSNMIIKNAREKIYQSSKTKLSMPETAKKMQEWFPKIEAIRSASEVMITYIEQIKSVLKRKTDLKGINDFLTEVKIKELNIKLEEYKTKLLPVDSVFMRVFPNNITVKSILKINNWQSGKQDLANSKNVGLDLALITKLENDIYRIENGFVEYCYYQVGMLDGPGSFDKYGFLIGQNANILKAGTELIIEAGVGAYSSSANAHIVINNRKVETIDGYAVYKLKVSDKPGIYSIPVVINFLDNHNILRHEKKNIQYEVSPLQ